MPNLNQTALIIFVRNPVLGKVKTRLAKDLGDEKTLAIYHLLLQHTLDVTLPLACEKFVYYADEPEIHDIWNQSDYIKKQQSGKDVGERMLMAFSELFELGYKRVLIIGSDCFQLSTNILEKSMTLLNSHSAVLGPASDGGYYLLGMNTLLPDLFINKPWSSDQVAALSIADFQNHGLSYSLLDKLNDVDTIDDLPDNYLKLLGL